MLSKMKVQRLPRASRVLVARSLFRGAVATQSLVMPVETSSTTRIFRRHFGAGHIKTVSLSAAESVVPPFPTAIIYNQSKHASGSVLADIRAVWGNKIRVLQTVETGLHPLPGVDGAIFIPPKTWGDMKTFGKALDSSCALDHGLKRHRNEKRVVFMAGWSAFAESHEAAVAVTKLGLVWPGTEPKASARLEKIGFKNICRQVGAPTPNFVVLSEEGDQKNLNDPVVKEAVIQQYMAAVAAMKSHEKGLIKSIHGGGGKGTAHLDNPQDPEQVPHLIYLTHFAKIGGTSNTV